jgi:hypothetical protein
MSGSGSGIDKAKKALDVAGHGLQALETIGDLARGGLSAQGFSDDRLDKATDALHTIVSIVSAIRGGLEGTVSLEQIDAEIKKVASSLADNDAAAQGDLDAKFPTG